MKALAKLTYIINLNVFFHRPVTLSNVMYRHIFPTRLVSGFSCLHQTRALICVLLPGGEPEDSGDETGCQAADAGLWWCPTQSSFWTAQLWFLLLLPEPPTVECLQELHDFLVFLCSTVLFCFPLLLQSARKVHLCNNYFLRLFPPKKSLRQTISNDFNRNLFPKVL